MSTFLLAIIAFFSFSIERVTMTTASSPFERKILDEIPESNRINLSSFDHKWHGRNFSIYAGGYIVYYNAYRISHHKFAMLGLILTAHSDLYRYTTHGCEWRDWNGSTISGETKTLFPGDGNRRQYEVIVVICTLSQETGSDGGYLVGFSMREEILLLQEEKKETQPSRNFESKLTICGSPVFGNLVPRAIWEWLEYHRYVIGVDKFHFYVLDGLEKNFTSAISEYIESGIVEITVIPPMPFTVWANGQVLFLQDCLYRTKRTSRWSMMIDLDEYVQAMAPHSMESLLKVYQHKAWMTHQAMWWHPHSCNSLTDTSLFGIQRMVFRERNPRCGCDLFAVDMCFLACGHRKYIVNPRKVAAVRIHGISIPEYDGVDLSLLEMRHNHYRGYHVEHDHFCSRIISDGRGFPGYEIDYSVFNLTMQIANYKTGNTSISDSQGGDDDDGILEKETSTLP